MPLFEPARQREDRLQIVTRVQVPFAALALALFLVILIARDASLDRPCFVLGLAMIGIATLAGWAVPWERLGRESLAVVGVLDLLGCILVDLALAGPMPSVFLLAAPPLLWLAYGFSGRVLAAAVLGVVLIAGAPFLSGDGMPSDPGAWANAVFLVLGAVSVLGAVHAVARLQRRDQRRLRSSHEVRNRMLNVLRLQEAVVRTFGDTLDVGLLFLTPDGEVGFTNKAFQEMNRFSGFTNENMHGAHVYEADRVTRRAKADDTFERVRRGEFVDGELIWIGEPGNQRAILATTRPVDAADGTRIGYAVVSSDATRLAQEVRVREEFLAGVSHELRTPLTSIVGFLDIIDETVDAGALGIERELGVIQRNVDQLLARIEDLLHVSDRTITLRRRPSDISRLATEAADAMQCRATDGGVTLAATIEPGVSANIDPRRIGQVLDNLLTNALKYTPAGGHVSLLLERRGDEIVIAVSDTGIGIAPEDQRQVFERFFRTDTARTSATPGAGLGLAIVASILTAHGGHASVSSELGRGSIFTACFPQGPPAAL